MEKREMKMIVEPIFNHLKNRNVSLIKEFQFKGPTKFDIFGYDRSSEEFYLVECKKTKRTVSFGQTIGQLISYMSIISSNTKDLLEQMVDKYHILRFEDIKRILEKDNIPLKFYVAFLSEDTKKNSDYLRWISEDFLEKRIGIILVDKNRKVNFFVESKTKEIPIIKTPENPIEYLKNKIKKDILEKFENGKLKPKVPKSYVNVYFRRIDMHFEIWFRKKKKKIEIGLHLENGKEKNNRIIKCLKRKENLLMIKTNIPNIAIGRFGKSPNWKKASETIDWSGKKEDLTERYLDGLIEKLNIYIQTLKPLLDDIKWGRKP